MAERRAILIGVDGYGFQPLTSAVNDAIKMRDALVSRSTPQLQPIFDDAEVTLLATPHAGVSTVPGTSPATRDVILNTLRPHYDAQDPAGFLLVFFAGHGLAVSPDGRVRETLILPSDATGPEDGRNMISVNELLNLFAERGPLQQIWIIDACRDMPYQRRPRGYTIEWVEQPPQGPRAQVALFAVAQGGSALSESGGQGRLTSHLLSGLAGKGSAADYIPARGYCVTAQSLHDYAKRRVAEALEGYDDWTRTIQLPQITQGSSSIDPLRNLPPPSPQRFAVTVRPPEAGTAVKLTLEVQPGLPVHGWPPVAPPRVYELRATLHPGMGQLWGEPKPTLLAVDLREQEAAIVDVPRRVPQHELPVSQLQPTTGERGIARAQTIAQESIEGVLPTAAPSATLEVRAADRAAHVRLRRAEAPWNQLEGSIFTPIDLSPGVWDVMVAIGDETISATRIVLHNGERRTIEAVAQITPATAALLPPTSLEERLTMTGPAIVMPSETIGPMQGAILPTVLPLLALKLYDSQRIILHDFENLKIPLLSVDEIPEGEVPFAVAVAVEGPRPPERPAVVEGARLEWVGAESRVGLFAGWKRDFRDTVSINIGSRQVNIAAPGIRGGVTAVACTSWPDGRLDFSVGIFRLPIGTLWDPKAPAVLVSGIARALALAAPLFRAGTNLEKAGDVVLSDIAYAKWLDPVLGALAFHARDLQLTAETGRLDPHLKDVRETIRRNLGNYFRDLPDSRIIAALDADADLRRDALIRLLDFDFGQPVLTASLAYLAQAATDAGREDHWAVERLARIVPGQVFNAVRIL